MPKPKDDGGFKKVECDTCGLPMTVDKESRGGKCWRCVASGRAFQDPVEARKRPPDDISSDEYLNKVDGDIFAPGYQSKKQQEKVEKKEAKVVRKVKKQKVKRKTNRLGQTKVIDELLKTGMSPEKVAEEVHKRIPAYPVEKLPTLIKIRQYHIKKQSETQSELRLT